MDWWVFFETDDGDGTEVSVVGQEPLQSHVRVGVQQSDRPDPTRPDQTRPDQG